MSPLKWAAVVGVLAVIAGIFGFVLAIEVVAGIAKLLFYVLVAALVVLLGLGFWTYKKVT